MQSKTLLVPFIGDIIWPLIMGAYARGGSRMILGMWKGHVGRAGTRNEVIE